MTIAKKLEFYRAHIPRAPDVCIKMQHGSMLLTTFTYTYEVSGVHGQWYAFMHSAMGKVDGCGYDD